MRIKRICNGFVTQLHLRRSTMIVPGLRTLLIILLLTQWVHVIQLMETSALAQVPPPPVSQLPLVQPNNLVYVGGFRVPNGSTGTLDPNDTFSYSSGAIALNPADGGMFLGCHVYTNGAIAEINIPPLVNSSDITQLNTATIVQQASPGLLNLLTANDSTDPLNQLGGLMVIGSQIYGTGYVYYDAGTPTMYSHFVCTSTNLASTQVIGACEVQNQGGNGGFVGGYMCAIPSNWQSSLGNYTYMTGLGGLSIICRTSLGPGLFGFNPGQLSTSAPAPSTPYVYYTCNNPGIGAWGSNTPANPSNTVYFNGLNTYGGAVFVPGSRTVLVFGAQGTGAFCYGEPGPNTDGQPDCNDACRGGKGMHSVGGLYEYQVWAYDANDFVSVLNGQKQPWEVVPYKTWPLSFPYGSCSCDTGGVAFDPASGTIYFCQLGGDTVETYSYLPVIQAFQIVGLGGGGGGSSPPPPPPPGDGNPGHGIFHQRPHFGFHPHLGFHEHFGFHPHPGFHEHPGVGGHEHPTLP